MFKSLRILLLLALLPALVAPPVSAQEATEDATTVAFYFAFESPQTNRPFKFTLASSEPQAMKITGRYGTIPTESDDPVMPDGTTYVINDLSGSEYFYVEVEKPELITRIDFSRADDSCAPATIFHPSTTLPSLAEVRGDNNELEVCQLLGTYAKNVSIISLRNSPFNKGVKLAGLTSLTYLDLSTANGPVQGIEWPQWPSGGMSADAYVNVSGHSLFFNDFPTGLIGNPNFHYSPQKFYQTISSNKITNVVTVSEMGLVINGDPIDVQVRSGSTVLTEGTDYTAKKNGTAQDFYFIKDFPDVTFTATCASFPDLAVTSDPVDVKVAYYKVFGFDFSNNGDWKDKKFSFRLSSDVAQPMKVRWFNYNVDPTEYTVTQAMSEFACPEVRYSNPYIDVYVAYPDKVTNLDFSRADDSHGMATGFTLKLENEMPSLQELKAAFSGLKYVSNFEYLPDCKRAELQHNQMTSLSLGKPATPDGYYAMEYLDASYNQLNYSPTASTYARNLKHIDLSHNSIKSMNASALKYLNAAEYIDVSNQENHALCSVEWPEDMSNVKTLKCEGNSLYFNMLPHTQDLAQGAAYTYGDQNWNNGDNYQKISIDNIINKLGINRSYYKYDDDITHAQWQVDGRDIECDQTISSSYMYFTFPESHDNIYCLLTHDRFPGLTITAGPVSIGQERKMIAQINIYKGEQMEGTFTFKVKTDGRDNEIYVYNSTSSSAKPLYGGLCSQDSTVFTSNLTKTTVLFVYSTNPAGITSLDFSAPEGAGGETTTELSPQIIYAGYTFLPALEEFICDNRSGFQYATFYGKEVAYAPAIKRISVNNTSFQGDVTRFFGNITEYPALEYLSMSGSGLRDNKNLRFSIYPNLKELNVSGNKLTGLDAGTNTKLTLLNCANNAITSLTLPAEAEQPYALDCSGNALHFLTLPAPAAVPGAYAYDPQANVDLKFSGGSIDVSKVTDDAAHIAVFEGSEGDTQLRAGDDYLVVQQGTSIRIRFTQAHESVRVRFGHTGFADNFYIWSNPVTGITPVDNSGASVILHTNQASYLPLEVGVTHSASTSSIYPLLVDWGDGEIAIPFPHRQEDKRQPSPDFYGNPVGDVKIYDPDNKLRTLDVAGREISKLTVTGASTGITRIEAQQNALTTADLSAAVATTINLSENSLETVSINTEAAISSLNLSHNRLHFGTLPLPSENIKTYVYTDQEKVALSAGGYTVTATEYMPVLNGTPTTAKWFEADGTEIDPAEYEQTADGVFTFKGEHLEMYCEMYNDLFPGLTITSKPVSVFDPSLDGYQLAFTMTFPASEIGKDFEFSIGCLFGKHMVDRGDGELSAVVSSYGEWNTMWHGDNKITISGKNDTDPVVVKVYSTRPEIIFRVCIPYYGEATLSDIDVSRLVDLKQLAIHGHNLSRDLDLTQNTKLGTLFFEACNLTGLTLGEQENLEYLYLSNSREVTAIDVSGCPALETLMAPANAIKSLDLSNNPNLKTLDCGGNQLSGLDLSHNTLLESVQCNDNLLTGLDLSHNPALTLLGCYNNQLSELDLTANTKLSTLRCQNNQISTLRLNPGQQFGQFICYGNRLYFDTMLDPALLTSDKLTDYQWFAQQTVPLSATGNMISVERYRPVFAMGEGDEAETCETTFELYYQNNGADALMTEGTDYTFDPEQGIITMLKGYADASNGIKPVKVRFRNAAFGAAYTASYDTTCDYIDSEWVTYTTENIEDQLKPLVRFTVAPGAAADTYIRLGTNLGRSSTMVRIDYNGAGGWEDATDGHDEAFIATEPEWTTMYNKESFLINLPASVDDNTEATVTIWGNENEVVEFLMERTRGTDRPMVGVNTEQSQISRLLVGSNAITDLRRVKANPATLTNLRLSSDDFTAAFKDNITDVYPGYKYFGEYTKLRVLDVQNCGLVNMDLTPQQATLTDLLAGNNYWRNRTVGEGGGLDLRNFNALVVLSVRICDLTKVDVTTNPALESLDASYNKDLSEIDLGNNPQLYSLWIDYCDFAELDLTANPLLREYDCRYNRFRFDTLLHPDHLSTDTAPSVTGNYYSNNYKYAPQADLWIEATEGDSGILNAVDATKYMPTVTGNETRVKWFGNCESTDHSVRDGWQWTNRRIHMLDSVPGQAYATAFAAYADLPSKEESKVKYGPEDCWDTPSKAAGYATDDDIYDYGYAANGKYQFMYKTPAIRAEFNNPVFPDLTLYTNKVAIDGQRIITGVEDVTADEAEPEYYTIQGIRMPARSRDELSPGIYIERRGRQTTKIMIR